MADMADLADMGDEPKAYSDEQSSEQDVEKQHSAEAARPGEIAKPGPPTFPEGGTKAWLVVLGAMLVNASSFGYASCFGVYQTYYQSHQLSSSSPSQIAWIGSIQVCSMFMGGLVSGIIFDRYGARPLLIPSSLLYVASIMLTSVCKDYYHFILAQGLLGGISNGFLFTPSISAVNHYFREKRGAALGAVAIGSPAAGVIFPIVLKQCFDSKTLGFGWGVRIVGFSIFLMLAIACVLIKERLPPRRGPLFAPQAFVEPAYIFIVLGVFFLFWGIYYPYFFISEYASEKIHMSSNMAFYTLSILNASSLPGRIMFGILGDRFGMMNMLLLSVLSAAITLFCWTQTASNVGLVVWTVIFGVASGGIFSLFPACVAAVVPQPQLIGTYLGQAMAIFAIAGLTGSPIAGALVANYGYFNASIFAGLSMLVGFAFVFASRAFRNTKIVAKV